MNLTDRIQAVLGAYQRTAIDAGSVSAAVLVPLFEKDGEYYVLFTKRTGNLNHHKGEISFPGGVREDGDVDLLQTALRESWEEVGLPPAQVKILGVLDDFYSVYGYRVTPYVGVFPGCCQINMNPAEIDRIIEVPLAHLLKPEVFRAEDWVYQGRSRPVYFYTYENDEIWGLTAAILKQFLDLVFKAV